MILSIGLNVNSPVETDQLTTSLQEITKSQWDLGELLENLLQRFLIELDRGFSSKDFEPLLAYKGESISLLASGEPLQGILVGLTDNGQLKLTLKDGSEAQFASGEINHLRPQ